MAAIQHQPSRTFGRWLGRFGLALFLAWLGYGIWDWRICAGWCNGQGVRRDFDGSQASMVARYSCADCGMYDLTLERFLMKEGFSYPFIFRQYYSDEFYLSTERYSLRYITDRADTVLGGHGVHRLPYVPRVIEAQSFQGDPIATYVLDTLYQENLDNKPSVPLSEQFSFFGWREEAPDFCN